MKYKFIETQGCTSFGFTVNDKDIDDISKENMNEIIDYLCEQMKKRVEDNTMQLQDIVRSFQVSDWGAEKYSCETCGDNVSWDIWEI